MPRSRSEVEIAAGRLISAIQKERSELYEKEADLALDIMYKAHQLLQAAKNGSLVDELGGRSVAEYLDPVWVEMHPAVKDCAVEFARTIDGSD